MLEKIVVGLLAEVEGLRVCPPCKTDEKHIVAILISVGVRT